MADEPLGCCWCSYLRLQAHLRVKPIKSKRTNRCNACHTFRVKFGFDRTIDTIEAEIEREQRKMLVASFVG